MNFEWDTNKARANRTKHGVTFEAAQTVFDDPLATISEDPAHAMGETRYLVIGESFAQETLVVSFTERGDNIRIISARLATRRERIFYEENQ